MLREVVSGRALRFAACCLAAPLAFVLAMDKVEAPLAVALAAAPLILAAVLHPDRRAETALLALALPLCFLGGEVVFRLRHFGPPGLSFDLHRPAGYGHPWSRFEYDTSTYTGLKPDTTVWFRGQPFEVNDLGFRGRRPPFEKPAGVYRIVAAGASATMGTGVAEDDVVFAHLERGLNAAGLPVRIEVVNLSIGASQFGEMLHVVQEVGPRFEPDLVLFLANRTLIPSGDIEIRPRPVRRVDAGWWEKTIRTRFRVFESRFFVAGLIRDLRDGWKGRGPDDEEVGRLREQEQANLVATLDELARQDAATPVVLYLLKPIFHLENPDHDRDYRQRLGELAAARGLDVVDTYAADFRPHTERDLMVYPGDHHPNATAQRLYAEAMAPELIRLIRRDLGLPSPPPGGG